MDIYICKVCGHIEFGTAPDVCPVCHAAKAAFQKNNSIFEDSAKDNSEGIKKHTPCVITRKDALIEEGPSTDVKVRIGEVLHPMLENHFIHFIDCYIDGKFTARAEFSPEAIYPATDFYITKTSGKVTIVERCNLHGYWRTDVNL